MVLTTPEKSRPGIKGRFRVLVFPTAHLPIRRVDAVGNDIDDDLARTDYGTWKIAVLEDFRSTVPFNESCLHFTFTPTVVRTPSLLVE
jgi:hypothetical protein